jgi:oxalate decarboxylase/phosphoglucose isomerase-like protein (cupin superfamily)
MKFRASDLRRRIPGPVSLKWLQGEPFAVALRHGSMTLELYAPGATDAQVPHTQDELYFIHRGSAVLVLRDEHLLCHAGDALFVPAGAPHRFQNMTGDFETWVVLYGPAGGEGNPPATTP